MANRILALLRAFFGWAQSKDFIDTDPTAGVRPRVKEIGRDRILDDDEIIAFWAGCDSLGYPFGPLFKLLLITLQRRDEVGGLRRSELNLEKREWFLPPERAKNDNGVIIHLSDIAVELIETIPCIDDADLLFTTNGGSPVSGFSKAKDRLDLLMNNPAPWTLHDLRRTGASCLARLGTPPHITDKLLNHIAAGRRGIAAIYDRYQYLSERKAALETWGRFIENLVRPTPGNVVPLRRG
jgi:integrase